MKTSIETIAGNLYTVIWVNANPTTDGGLSQPQFHQCGVMSYHTYSGTLLATALPALPKHPKPDSETPPLLLPYRYASEGIFVVGIYGDEDHETCSFRQFLEMYHNGRLKTIIGAVDANGNRVEVAIWEE